MVIMSGSGYVLTVDESHYLSIRVERVDMLISKMQCISAFIINSAERDFWKAGAIFTV